MTIETPVYKPRPPDGYIAAQKVQIRIIGALMVREAMSRFGHENLGFFWIMGEPLLLTVAVMIMWTLSGGTHGSEVGVVPFILTGYSSLTLWRHIVSRSVHAMRNNVGLLFHRNVRFLDILIARYVLETLGGLAAFMVAYVPLTLLGLLDPMDDPLTLLLGWFLLAWFSSAFGLLLAGMTELSDILERFVAPIMYVTLPLTGAFYMVHWLPESAQQIVVWSPLVSCFEMFRAGLFGSKVMTEYDPGYVIVWCLSLTAIGLPLAQYAQRNVRLE
jgi:capsular polysaccharide transport system permease protein